MLKNIFFIIIQLITAPQDAWQSLSEKKQTQKEFHDHYLFPIIGIIAFTSFVGGLWLTRDGNMQIALKNVISGTVTVFAGYYIVSFILNELSTRFGMLKDEDLFRRFTGYSSSLLYALYILLPLFPDFFVLWLFAFYTGYIVYIGAEYYLNVEEEKRVNFTSIATVVLLLVPGLINILLKILIK